MFVSEFVAETHIADTSQEQKLEGEFRYAHSRVITHSEEIAFYGGHEKEKQIVNSSFDKISRHVTRVYQMRFLNGIFDSVFVKYLATVRLSLS
jgi:ATP-binding cassette subfamily D (ALD) protein 3